MNELEQMLRREVGLDPLVIGPAGLQRAVGLRSTALGLKSASDYSQLARRSATEWNEFVEAVLVAETWFFRDAAAFVSLARIIRIALAEGSQLRPFRILTVPCSSGEEPYSLVIALADAGIPRHTYHIDAIDISARSLAKAERGVYTRNSFRGRELWFRQRYFQERNGEYTLAPSIRDQVRFTQGNLLDRNLIPAGVPYDFIFCRNLLIYFDSPSQSEAIARLESWLAPNGIIFAGPAEPPLFLARGFASASLPMSFACRRIPGPKAGRGAARLAPPSEMRFSQVPAGSGHSPTCLQTRPAPGSTALGAAQIAAAAGQLAEARLLANSGQYNQALALCERHLREHGPGACAWYLLGKVRSALGHPAAAECFRKALYLEPNHYESLLQLAACAERTGDAAAAQRYRDRASRVQVRKETP